MKMLLSWLRQKRKNKPNRAPHAFSDKPGTCASISEWGLTKCFLEAEHGCHLREQEEESAYKEFTIS